MSLSPTERIPVEVLCEIFIALKAVDPIGPQNRYGWIPQVTHVCQRWRNEGTALAELWADVICAFKSQSATDTILGRARDALLSFRALWPSERRANIQPELTPHQTTLAYKYILRVKSLIQPLYRDWTALFRENELPNLNRLDISAWDLERTTIYTDALKLNAPRLRELTLHGLLFPVNSPNLRSLRVLVHSWNIGDGVHPSLLLDFLEHTPLLEDLALYFDLTPDGIEHRFDRIVSLPHLRKLHLSHNFTLWRNIRAPTDIDIHVELDYDTHFATPNVDIQTLFDIMDSHLRASPYDGILVGDLHQYDGSVRSYLKMWSSVKQCRNPCFRLDVVADYDDILYTSVRILRQLTRHIKTRNFQSLFLDGIGNIRHIPQFSSRFRRVLLSFTDATSVSLNASQVQALRPSASISRGSIQDPLDVLPKLDNLTVVKELRERDEQSPDELRAQWNYLTVVIKERKDVTGRAIRTLTFETVGRPLASVRYKNLFEAADVMRRLEGLAEEVVHKHEYSKNVDRASTSFAFLERYNND